VSIKLARLPQILSETRGVDIFLGGYRSFEVRSNPAGTTCFLVLQTRNGDVELLESARLDEYGSEIASTFRHSRVSSIRLYLRRSFGSRPDCDFTALNHALLFTHIDDYVCRALVKEFPRRWQRRQLRALADTITYSFSIWSCERSHLQAWLKDNYSAVAVPTRAEWCMSIWECVNAWSGGAVKLSISGDLLWPSGHQHAVLLRG
jgi:hypothetical protein